MGVKVLDVGNCDPDHSGITALLRANFEATVDRAHGFIDAMEAVRREQYDLVTINRLMDRDGSLGIEIIKAINADPELAATKVMMITNFAEHQELAQQAGAVLGFGKSALRDASTVELLSEHLTSQTSRE